MTIDEAIALVDNLKPNQIERERKIEWLSRLDQWIWDELICRREKKSDTPAAFTPYAPAYQEEGAGQEASGDTLLLVPAPYDEMYRWYLEFQIDAVNQEYEKMVNSERMYLAIRGQYVRSYYREHRMIDPGYYHKF